MLLRRHVIQKLGSPDCPHILYLYVCFTEYIDRAHLTRRQVCATPLAGEGVGGPNSDEGTDTVVL
jgi:hypothetical protein